MLKDIQASLYDFFGYLFPGIVLFAALCLCISNLSALEDSVAFAAVTESAPLIASGLFASYLLGHLANGIGNADFISDPRPEHILYGGLSPKGDKRPEDKANLFNGVTLQPLNDEWRLHVEKAIQSVYGLGDLTVPSDLRAALVDEARLVSAREGERDVYWYREGFYRALTVALLAFSSSLAWRAALGPLNIVLDDTFQFTVSVKDSLFLLSLALLSAWISYRRFHRFGATRSTRALAVLLIAAASSRVTKEEA